MWHSSGPQGPAPDQEQLQRLMRRSQAPDNEVPVTVPLGLVLARSDDTAVLLPSAQVFRHGVSLDIAAVTRRRGSGRAFSMPMHGPMERGAGAFLLGVELSDGRRASTLHRRPPFDAPDDEPVLMPAGGGGGSRRMDSRHFLSPIPPPGKLVFVVSWTDWGIGETRTEISADPIIEAASRVRELWPWEAEPSPDEPPSQPSPGGWFAQ
ncbi:MAG: hypothetical protein ACR2NJ_00430 [Acidimicrobiales bacterium]